MHHRGVRSVAFLIPIVLIGLLLSCGLGLPGSSDEISLVTSRPVAVLSLPAGEPELPRDFTLPPVLFAPGSA